MNAKEVAKLLELHPNTVYGWIKDGTVKAEKVGRSYEIPTSEVNKLKHSQDYERLSKAQESAAYQLLINVEDEISSELLSMKYLPTRIDFEFKINEIDELEDADDAFTKVRKLYEEKEDSVLKEIVDTSLNIKRLYEFRDNLQKVIDKADETNTVEKSKKHWDDLFNFKGIDDLLKGDKDK